MSEDLSKDNNSMDGFIDDAINEISDLDIEAILYDDGSVDTQADVFTAVRDPELERSTIPELATGPSGVEGKMRSDGDSGQESSVNKQTIEQP